VQISDFFWIFLSAIEVFYFLVSCFYYLVSRLAKYFRVFSSSYCQGQTKPSVVFRNDRETYAFLKPSWIYFISLYKAYLGICIWALYRNIHDFNIQYFIRIYKIDPLLNTLIPKIFNYPCKLNENSFAVFWRKVGLYHDIRKEVICYPSLKIGATPRIL